VTLTLGDPSLALNEIGLTSVSAAELFRRLQPTPHLAPSLDFTIPSMGPSLAQNIVLMRSKQRLQNLNLTDITAAQLINAVKKEERSLSTSEWERKRLRSYASTLMTLMRWLVPKSYTWDQPGSFPPYTSTFTMEPVENDERLLELRDLVRKDFPGGKILDPY